MAFISVAPEVVYRASPEPSCPPRETPEFDSVEPTSNPWLSALPEEDQRVGRRPDGYTAKEQWQYLRIKIPRWLGGFAIGGVVERTPTLQQGRAKSWSDDGASGSTSGGEDEEEEEEEEDYSGSDEDSRGTDDESAKEEGAENQAGVEGDPLVPWPKVPGGEGSPASGQQLPSEEGEEEEDEVIRRVALPPHLVDLRLGKALAYDELDPAAAERVRGLLYSHLASRRPFGTAQTSGGSTADLIRLEVPDDDPDDPLSGAQVPSAPLQGVCCKVAVFSEEQVGLVVQRGKFGEAAITAVNEGSPAAQRELMRGDVIVGVNSFRTSDYSEVLWLLRHVERPFHILVLSDSRLRHRTPWRSGNGGPG
mmetsp:Transcript_4079/g.11985  ORF Transcript_4079/g.11985 Transcript_4079/m.11985 type:complete len:364 (-) Transcript_4079:10-1101(-)